MMISIIVGTYNAAKTLERCLASIIGQTSSDWEILVSDGASSDDTLNILRRHSEHLSHLVSEPDTGVYEAWNRVVPHARGDWLMFLGADDQLASPDTIAEIVAKLNSSSITTDHCDFVYGATELVDRGKVVEKLGVEATPNNSIPIMQEVSFAHTGLLHNRAVFEAVGLFDERFKSAGDYEFLLRCALGNRGRVAQIGATVAKMATGGMSNSTTGRKWHYSEMIAARKKHSLGTPIKLRSRYAKASALAAANKVLSDDQLTNLANLYRTLRGKPQRSSL